MLQTRYYYSNEFIDYENIFKKYPYRLSTYKKGDYLVKPGDFFTENHYIVKGLVKVAVVHDNGEEKNIAYFGPGSIYPIITNSQDFILEQSIIVQALRGTETFAFTFDTTKRIMAESPEIGYGFVDHYCKFTNFLFFSAISQTFEDLKTRICNILYIYYTNSGDKRCDLTQSDLASFIGATRNSVVKVLKILREEGCIQTSKQYIEIIDVDKITDYCSLLTIQ